MNSLEWEKQHIEALYTTAEDIQRFAPWDRDIAPFVMADARHPEKQILVVFEADHDNGMDIRFIVSPQGIRAWILEEQFHTENFDEAFPSIDELVNCYEGDYMEVGFETANPNNFEKRLQGAHPSLITFRRQRPGCRLEMLNRRWEYEELLHYMKQTLKVLRVRLGDVSADGEFALHALQASTILQTASFLVDEKGATRQAPFVFTRTDFLALLPAVLDEFSNARVKHLLPSQKVYELFYFYLPSENSGKEMLPLAVFLVDLESGLIEWNDVFFEAEHLAETFLRHLWAHFIALGHRPETIMIQNLRCYRTFARDMLRAGIAPQYIDFSYVGQELFESYVETMRLKEHQLLADRFPRDPSKNV